MYESYGSYGSMPVLSEIFTSSETIHITDQVCASPSWPNRNSLNGSNYEELRVTSFVSDSELCIPNSSMVPRDTFLQWSSRHRPISDYST
ncbi:hypothetical protein J3E69DRAFT_337517 [Trichoderma sp. SZMC 28015]